MPSSIITTGATNLPHLQNSIPKIKSVRKTLLQHELFCQMTSKKSLPYLSILTDTREQLPLWIRCNRRKLVVGDYTSERLFNKVHIERKSGIDLYGSLIQGHVRFSNMFLRAEVYSIRCLLFVECTRKQFITLKFPGGHRRKMKGEVLEKILSSFMRNRQIEIVWCASRENMKRKIRETIIKYEKRKA